ncbi:g-type lectin s-receptor-like serine/threonine-protein kinase [Quercus suber]|uniref:G-type lectin s-receptor-like serine/threonine-protein kinase n=1 Tax=Quercus suber TaxID=58331 RepID=A0AAW0M018_QUESU
MHQQRRYLELADPRLEGRVTSEEVEKLVRIALCCVHEDPALRPSMAHVVGMLEGGLSLGEPRSASWVAGFDGISGLWLVSSHQWWLGWVSWPTGYLMLEGGLSLGEPRSESLNFLRFYGQRFIEESRMEGSNELKDLGLYPDINATSNSAAGVSYNPMSYISSQQLSGPRFLNLQTVYA